MDSTAFVLGNGPSLRGVDLARFTGEATVGMNAAYREWDRIGWYPTHYACLDEELIATHHEAIRRLIDERAVETAFLTARFLDFYPEFATHERCFFLDSFRKAGRWRERRQKYGLTFSEEPAFTTSAPTKLTTGGYAVRFAIFLGYRSIYLLGIDCNYVEILPDARSVGEIALEMSNTPEQNPNYFFDDYQQAGDRYNVPNPEVHDGNLHLQALEAVRDDVVQQGIPVEIRNLSRRSKLASEGTFPYQDLDRVLEKRRLGAVAVPMVFAEEEMLVANLERWATPAATPRFPADTGYAVPLVLVLNGKRDPEFEDRVTIAFARSGLCPRSFSKLEFLYCELSAEEDKYQRDYSKKPGPGGHKSGPNAQFFRSMVLLRDHGPYVFMMETDCIAVRPNWLVELERIVDGAEPCWMLGSMYRGVGEINERYRVHINGNAVYAVGDEEFQTFLSEVWRPALDRLVKKFRTLAYDCVLPLHFFGEKPAPSGEEWDVYRTVAHRFRFTDFMQNHASTAELERNEGKSLDEIRDGSPRTYIVHGRHFLEAGSEDAPEPQGVARPSSKFEAVAVHQMGKVGSRSIVNAVEALGLWPCFHTHVLSTTHNPSLRPEVEPVVPPRHSEIPDHIFATRDLRARFIDRGVPVAVVTAVREPIGRNVSAFFQNLDGFVEGSGADPEDPHELYELFRKEYFHFQPQRWIERELNEPLGIDVFAEPFPVEGALTLEASPHGVLVLKASVPDERKAAALRGFLEVDALRLARVNVTEKKAKRAGRSTTLSGFMACVGQDEAYIDEMLGMRMTQHFFTEQEREGIRAHWLALGASHPALSG